MNIRQSLFLTQIAAIIATVPATAGQSAAHPNILFIYGDDVGYGDLGCYGATEVRTPNVDRLAKEGLRFTNAYASSATCTPSRFSLLTGEYPFRQKGTGVLPGNAALIIRPGSLTLPAILKRAGYTTAVVGKWHLGLGNAGEGINWNGEIKPGPLEVGFDYSYIVPATPDRVPCVYVQDHHVVGLDPKDPIQVSYRHPIGDWPTGRDHPELLKMGLSEGHAGTIINGISRIGYMSGGKAALWKDHEMEAVLVRQAIQFIERAKGKPFFLYYASHDIHVPRVPGRRFVGKTTMGPRGDEIVEFDWGVGRLLDELDRLHLADNTLVILSSDNGPVLDDGYKDDANEKVGRHKPAGPLRAGKYSLFEGGTRVPFLVRWPGRVKPGVSGALISQVDMAASLAALTGQHLEPGQVPDSLNLLPVLLGDSPTGRTSLVEAAQGQGLAMRTLQWKFIPPGHTPDGLGPWKRIQIPDPGFLFKVEQDLGEVRDVAAEYPEVVRRLGALLDQTRAHPIEPGTNSLRLPSPGGNN